VKLVRALVTALAVTLVMSASAVAATIPGRYIVVLKDSVADPGAMGREHARRFGAQPDQTYRSALKGYAATIPSVRLDDVRSDPKVAYVVADSTMGQPDPVAPPPVSQTTTRDMRRIAADLSSAKSGDGGGAVSLNVAVLDTGIDIDHPDLNVAGGTNCTSSRNGFDDGDGHGSHVAGTIGARDNAIGMVGVGPGTPLWAVKVLTDQGVGRTSTVLCGIDWVTATRQDANQSNDIAVANMSLGDKGSDDGACGMLNRDPVHQAICRSVAAGVVYTVSAGNDTSDVATKVPAAYDEVLTVTAMADSDGEPGSLGATTLCNSYTDDTPAGFSNFATLAADQTHTVSAPGECVSSTYSDGRYAVLSGTSMASPHVAGTVALCVWSGDCRGLTAAEIKQKILADAAAYNQSRKGLAYGFQGDPLRPTPGKYYGYLIRAGLY
jgi:subtilisin